LANSADWLAGWLASEQATLEGLFNTLAHPEEDTRKQTQTHSQHPGPQVFAHVSVSVR